MSIFSKIGSMGLGILGSKPIKKFAGNERVIKTTSQTVGSKIPAVAGGVSLMKKTAGTVSKGVSGILKVGGKAVIPAGAAAGALLGGAKIYDYIQDVRAKTPELRAYDYGLDLADKEVGILQKAKALENSTGDSGNLAMGGTLGDYLPVFSGINDKSADLGIAQAQNSMTKTVVYGALGMALIGAGAYIYKKRGK